DEEEASARRGDLADVLALEVEDRDDGAEERQEQEDDVPRSPPGEHQRRVQPDDQDGHQREARWPCRVETAGAVVRHVKRRDEYSEQRRDGHRGAFFHLFPLLPLGLSPTSYRTSTGGVRRPRSFHSQ